MTAVSDTSPLVLLAKVGQLQILRQVYGDILIPEAVHAEIVRGRDSHEDVAAIEAANWINVRPLRAPGLIPSGTTNLGAGEREAITLALEIGPDTTVLVDDSQGRCAAAALGMELIGTAGVLLTAKRLAFLDEVRPLLDKLRAAGLYLSERQYRRALMLAGE